MLRALRELLGERLLTDDVTLESCSGDASVFRVRPLAVVTPRDVEDVRATLAFAREEGLPVTARAGGTNTGGAAVGPGIVLLFRPGGPLSEIGSGVARGDGLEITAGSGARHDAVQQALYQRGFCLPSDPSSGPISLIGGNIGTRASGPHALRYGAIDRYLLHLRLLLADGTLVDTSSPSTIPAALARSLEAVRADLLADAESGRFLRSRVGLKSSAGYDLGALVRRADPASWVTALVTGGVGTLGIVLDATFLARPLPAGRAALLLCLRDLAGACRMVPALCDLGAAAIEIMNARSVELVRARVPEAGLPERTGHLLLVELDGEGALDRAHQAAELARRSGEALASDPVVSGDAVEIGGLWKARKLMLPLLRGRGGRYQALSVVNDVGVPPARLAEAMVRIERIFERRALEVFVYGHAGDGNLHLRPLFDTEDPGLLSVIAGVAEEVYGCVLELGGTVSGEHGMGMLRAPFLSMEWGPALARAMAQVKRAFDPEGILNPGAMLPALSLREALERYFPHRRVS